MKITIETEVSVIEIVLNETLPADLSSEWNPVERISISSLTDRSIGVNITPYGKGNVVHAPCEAPQAPCPWGPSCEYKYLDFGVRAVKGCTCSPVKEAEPQSFHYKR